MLIRCCPHRRASFRNEYAPVAAGTVCPQELVQGAGFMRCSLSLPGRRSPSTLNRGHWDIACYERLLFPAQHAFYSERGRLKGGSVLNDLWGIKPPAFWRNNKEAHLYSPELFKILPPWGILVHFLSLCFSLTSQCLHRQSLILSNNIFNQGIKTFTDLVLQFTDPLFQS